MRLINTTSGQLHEFFDSQRPSYAILSHTWGTEELSYLDLLYLTSSLPPDALGIIRALLRNPSQHGEGYRKYTASCRVARERGHGWLWIDSCCIDKSSSAELSEAINSMWNWYRDAAECLVYLADVSSSYWQNEDAPGSFAKSRWFTRGWTLQELLAPKSVLFYDVGWALLADKQHLGQQLSLITGIPLSFLDGTYDPCDCKLCSVAMKMSWLSARETTRVEDMAYCMFGLFDVHMPLIYGEGRKAFMRLQLQIIKKTDDDSIYAWAADSEPAGLLATWPDAFDKSGNIVQINFPADSIPWMPPSMTSLGLELRGRYARRDVSQQALDARAGVQTISTAIPTGDQASMVMYCGPCSKGGAPITQSWGPKDVGMAIVIDLRRFGATWKRVNCQTLDAVEYGSPDPVSMDAFVVYYIEQQGI